MGSLETAPAMLRSSYGTHVLRPTTKERGPGRVVALNALGLLAVFGVAAWTGGASPSRAALLATRAQREPQQRTVTVTAMDLVRQFPKVREALADMGDQGCVTQMYDYEACVEQYLPSSMVFTFDAAALEGDLGEGATGWLATCFNQYTLDTSTASLLVVFSPTGTIRAAIDHLERLVGRLFDDGVPGDLMEAGVFRGGACIFLRGLLAAAFPREAHRRVFVADSFAGIPPPRLDIEVAATGETHAKEVDPTADWTDRFVSGVDAVRYNFRRYGLLDGRVTFVEGFFNESLPPVLGSTSDVAPSPPPAGAPVLALLRIDADAYDGVLDALHGAYHRLSPGGAVVIDDWHLGGARAAVHKFRAARNIVAPLRPLPSDHVYTCTPDLAGLAACAAEAADARPGGALRRVFVQNKGLAALIGQHGAYWRKGWDEPGPGS